jgi:hypothetical protein
MSGRRQWGEDSSIAIKLSGGASVSLTFKGNLFDLMPAERELIANLSSVIQKYNGSSERPPAAAEIAK